MICIAQWPPQWADNREPGLEEIPKVTHDNFTRKDRRVLQPRQLFKVPMAKPQLLQAPLATPFLAVEPSG